MKYIVFFLVVLCVNNTKMFAQMKNYSVFDKEDFDKNGIPKSLNGQVIYEGYVKEIGYVVHQIGEYKNGKKHGHFIYFGKGRFRGEEHYKNGILNGYSSLGENSGFYKNGKKNGVWEYSNDTGDRKMTTYKQGKKHGYYESVGSTGKTTGKYKNDKEEGVWTVYDNNGKKLSETVYKNGVEINCTNYSEKAIKQY